MLTVILCVCRLSGHCSRTPWRRWITTTQRQKRSEASPIWRDVWPALLHILSSSAWRHAMRRSDWWYPTWCILMIQRADKRAFASVFFCVYFSSVSVSGIEEDSKVHSGAEWEDLCSQGSAHHRSHRKGDARRILNMFMHTKTTTLISVHFNHLGPWLLLPDRDFHLWRQGLKWLLLRQQLCVQQHCSMTGFLLQIMPPWSLAALHINFGEWYHSCPNTTPTPRSHKGFTSDYLTKACFCWPDITCFTQLTR